MQFIENDEIIPQNITEDTSHQQEPPAIPNTTETPRQMNDEETTNPITTRTKKSKNRLRKNPQSKRYSDFLLHEISNDRSSLRKTNTALQ